MLIRGPLAMGLLSGKYSTETRFTDAVRGGWHADEKRQADFQRRVAQVERLKRIVAPGEEMVHASLRYVISHPAAPVAIPGAKSPAQAVANARAGEQVLSAEALSELRAAMDG